ncbi:MAG TPA: hypothetical protein VKV20_16455 [Ktedonobacteraceae bacterium]|jgi:predicted PurR-regulated permease PerM|nr:hypothetical protein [Ktedonobacteraceae bacterium]
MDEAPDHPAHHSRRSRPGPRHTLGRQPYYHIAAHLGSSGLTASAITPLVALFRRFIPRLLAILASYLIVLIILGLVFYLIITTMIAQLSALANNVSIWLTPTSNERNTPLIGILLRSGLTSDQNSLRFAVCAQ